MNESVVRLRLASYALIVGMFVTSCHKAAEPASKIPAKDTVRARSKKVVEGPLTATQGATVELGDIYEGASQEVELHFKNTSSIGVDLRVRTSCGCSTGTLKKTRILSGEVGIVKAAVNTKGRTGGIHEFVDLIDAHTNTTLLTYWLVGKVKTTLRIIPTPDIVHCPDILVGAVLSRDLSLELLAEMGREPKSLRVTEVSSLTRLDANFHQEEWKRDGEVRAGSKILSRVLISGVLNIRTLVTGRFLADWVGITAFGEDDTILGFAKVMLRGSSKGSIAVDCDSIFLGKIDLVGEIDFQAQLTSQVKRESAPTVTDMPEWIRLIKVKRQGNTAILEFAASSGGGVSPRAFCEEIEVLWGDSDPVRLKIAGIRN